MKIALLLASVATMAVGTGAGAPLLPEVATPAPQAAPRLPGFAADLAQQPTFTGPSAWLKLSSTDAWRRLSTAVPSERQQARFDYARSLIRKERGAEALGVLDVMRQDDPDLEMVDNFRIARGAALVQVNRVDEAIAELSAPTLSANPEACIWRLRGLAHAGMAEQALQQAPCAAPAFAGRPLPRFRLAVARAAVEGGRPADALRWLSHLPDNDPATNLLRGRAEAALGNIGQARLRFGRVEKSGNIVQRMDARMSQIEADVAGGIAPDKALKRLDALRYSWRGDHIEERALQLTYRLNSEKGEIGSALKAGATLLRFYDIGRMGPDFLPELQGKLDQALDPEGKMPLDKAAGLYWDYRDLAPSGPQGDALVSRLAGRLQQAGMYGRAADLLEYQLFNRAGSLARGALSSRVASLHILSGRSDRALEVLKKSADPSYPDPMQFERKRMEAVALSQLGRTAEALAMLQDVPDAAGLRTEILWKQRDWQGLANAGPQSLPRTGALNEVGQVVVLRHAIALAMLRQEQELAGLRAQYLSSFAGLSTASVFDMLTAPAGAASAGDLAKAMAAIPGVSPAGDMALLLDPVTPVRSR
jgi:tetratricopeptide (TPR) repeat protein